MAVGATDPSRPIAGHRPSFCEARNRRFLLIAAILASALGFIDGTLVAIALPAIRAGLDATLTQALWINNGYLLPLSALILMGGALGDRFGLGRVFALGIGVFIAASVACALAPSPGFLIVARVIQGIGAALMVPGSLALIARAYPEEERGRAIGTWAAASALTTALGPILAGLALSLGGPEIWRWLFAINLPLGAIALFLVLRFVADDRAQPDHPLDLPGAALITGGLGLVTYALTAAGEHGGLANPGLLALGAALIAAFILWQARITNPMVPLGLFRDRGFAGANIATALIYLALSAILFFLPMTLIAGWGLAEIWASAAFAPLSILIPVLSAPAGRLADRYGAGPLIGLGAACVAVSFAALAAVVPVGPTALWWGVLPATALMGFGMGLVVAPLSTAIMTSVPTDRSGVASGINNAVSRVAGLIAVAALGSVAGGVYAVAGGTESFGALSDAAGHAEAMRRGFQAVAVITAALTAIGAVTAWVLIPRRVPLDR